MKRLLRVKQVAAITSMGISTVWRYVKEDKFPKPHKVSAGVTVWNSDDVEAWIEKQIA